MNIFDQTKATKLIIVHTDDTAQYANYLQLMISAVDDDGENVVAVNGKTSCFLAHVATTPLSDLSFPPILIPL